MVFELIDGPQGGLMVAHDDEGEGAPVLFVHSDGGVLGHWDQIRAHLAGRPTAAFDRRGHGASQPPRNTSFEQPDAAGDIGAVADALGWKTFVLVAHSGGASNAYTFAGLKPERLTGLVLVDPSPDPAILPPGVIDHTLRAMHSDLYASFIEQYYRSIAGTDHAVSDRVVRDAAATSRETIIGTVEAFAGFRPKDYAGRYTGPALSVIQPQFDIDGALHHIDPNLAHVAIEGAGHWIHLAAPARFAHVLDDFLARVDRGRNPTPGAGVAEGHATPHHSP